MTWIGGLTFLHFKKWGKYDGLLYILINIEIVFPMIPDNALNDLQIRTHSIFRATLRGKFCFYAHFVDEGTEAQRG